MARLLLLIQTTSYRATDFLNAAQRIGVEVIVGSDERQALEDVVPGSSLSLDFEDHQAAVQQAVEFYRRYPFDAVLSADEEGIVLATLIAARLGLPHNPLTAMTACKDKEQLRERLTAASVPTPAFQVFETDTDLALAVKSVRFPVVLKPTFLSASRGVIRANTPDEFKVAFTRISALMNRPNMRRRGGISAKKILVEQFIPGQEVALEGLLQKGRLSVLALFDKPDPLNGPYFEETIYVTPSRWSAPIQKAIADCTQRATTALGLTEGPIHAELRFDEQKIWMNTEGVSVIEVAARSIGGICSRTLRFGVGLSLEEIILRQAVNLPIPSLKRERRAAGVMMIPVPAKGILRDYDGVKEAKAVPHIEEVVIMIRRNQRVTPLPEGHRYLGFIFARGARSDEVVAALRESHKQLTFSIVPEENFVAP